MIRTAKAAATGVLLLGLLLPAVAVARNVRIGVVNVRRAVAETKDGKAAEAKLRALKKKLEAELNRKLKEFYAEEAKIRKSWSILKDEERRKRAAESQQKFQALQKRYLQAERELMKKKAGVMQKIQGRLRAIIAKIARRDGYDYIFANAAVLWAPRHVDLTNEVIRQYNRGVK